MPLLRVQVVGMDRPTVISTFAGCGGSSLGYRLAGFSELLAVEWDAHAVETFRLNFPDVPVYHGDIAALAADRCLEIAGIEKGELDILDGSPPCQGFSTAGKRKFNDPRNTLFREFVRLLHDLKPKAFIMENVSGLIKGCMKQAYLQIIGALRECGYRAKGELMNAMYYDVPQRRERVIIIGVREDLGIEPGHPKPAGRPITLYTAIGDLPAEQAPDLQHIWVDESPEGKNTKTWHLARKCEPGMKYAGHYIRMKWDEPSPTLLKPSGEALMLRPYLRNSHCHPSATRTLSPAEYKRIAAFPDWFRFPDPWRAMYQIGNCVPPNLMKAIALHVKENILETKMEKTQKT
jgi:DNA (cytosine-5)-methyltransferase 1